MVCARLTKMFIMVKVIAALDIITTNVRFRVEERW